MTDESENIMGIFDKAKDAASKAKDMVDDQVEKHGDKLPEGARDAYDKASEAAEKVIPGDDGAAAPTAD